MTVSGPEPEAGSPEEHYLRRSYIPMSWSDGNTVEDYYWRLDIPNGHYVIELAVGSLDDANIRDYQVTLNGIPVIDGGKRPSK